MKPIRFLRPFAFTGGFAIAALLLTAMAMQSPAVGPPQQESVGLRAIGIPISSLPFTIDECGRYFLTDCLTGVPGQNGITINAADVTLDLNGFSLVGPGSNHGINFQSAAALVRSNAARTGARALVARSPATAGSRSPSRPRAPSRAAARARPPRTAPGA